MSFFHSVVLLPTRSVGRCTSKKSSNGQKMSDSCLPVRQIRFNPKSLNEFFIKITFDKSGNKITRDRISDARIIGTLFQSDYYDKDAVTYLKFESGMT